MIFYKEIFPKYDVLRQAVAGAYHQDETDCVARLLKSLDFTAENEQKIKMLATELINAVRNKTEEISGVEALITYYDLSTNEGIMLMCIAEALLRIPDKETQNRLIYDKLTSADWEAHLGKSQFAFVNMATWGLALTGKILDGKAHENQFKKMWHDLLRRSGEPVIRQAVHEAVKIMGNQFVAGRNIDQALNASKGLIKKGYVYSYDMLGEVARTQEDADRYFKAYEQAILELAQKLHPESRSILHGPSISVKLSALYPRYLYTHREAAVPFLTERLHQLAVSARNCNIGLTVDAEEAERLDLSLDIFMNVFTHPDLKDWEGLGLAVQAYQKRAFPLIQWLTHLARTHKKRISVRLVKGAYWDTEIKLAQVGGYENYPVFTRKTLTDVSYLACAKQLLTAQDAIYPQFATHNAYSVAAILTLMGEDKTFEFEFQSLQGMGRALHNQLIARGIVCRIYAPVGSHEDLLPYLVRRLLENGANSSFVNQIAHPKTPLEKLISSPVMQARSYSVIPNPKIVLPKHIFADRENSRGVDMSDLNELKKLSEEMAPFLQSQWRATPLLQPLNPSTAKIVENPCDHRDNVGHVCLATKSDVETAVENAVKAYPAWNQRSVQDRADILLKASYLLEKHRAELITLMTREAGKTLSAGIAEVREAVDFCRYYAELAKKTLSPEPMPSPTGETNTLRLQGRGPLLCISPWNFPVAIFAGQIVASLVTGNAVIAKPAEQTPLVADRVVRLLHEAGVPETVLQLLPGTGETVGAALVADPRIQGVLFTGSTETAKLIQKTLAARPGPMVPLIAETGGVNAMIADSSALPEQLVADVLTSAFDSAGQRCSALRVLFIQEEIAEKVIRMLQGAMMELNVGNPLYLKTDVGPVIDKDAKKMLETHSEKMGREATLIYKITLPPETEFGTYIAPQAYELPDLNLLKQEVFGPILHVIRYAQNELDAVIDAINDLGYGLTFGIQSRLDSTIAHIQNRIQAGNIYVNRNMIGAVVGVQPFGGGRLSGTGPKAGGPHYLIRLCTENTLTINITAIGGNATLMALEDS